MLLASCAPVQSQRPASPDEVAEVSEQLADVDWRVRLHAAQRLQGELARSIPVIVELLESDIDDAKQPAADALNSLLSYGRPPKEPMPELEPAIKPLSTIISGSNPVETRRWAVIALTEVANNLGSAAIKRVVPVFTEAAADPEKKIRMWAMDGLGEFGRESKSAVPVVLKQLNGNELRSTAVKTLGKIHSDPQKCVPALLKILENPTPREKRNRHEKRFPIESEVARALAEFGPEANQAVPALMKLVGDEHYEIHTSAAFALANIGIPTPEALDALEKAYANAGDRLTYGHIGIVGALCALGETGKARAEKLAQGLEHFVIEGVGHLLIKPAETLEVISRVPSVTGLQLASSKLTDEELAPLAKMSQLESLVLPETTSDEGLRHIAGLGNLRLLRHQSTYAGNPVMSITDAGVAHLSNLSNLQQLTLWSSIEKDGLKHLSKLKQLRQLSLHGVSDEALRHLPALPLLEDVFLSGRTLTDAGMTHLSRLKSLKVLSLNGTSVGDAGVATLAKNHSGLVELGLWHSKITGECANDLAKFKSLKKLGIVNTPLADRDYESIRIIQQSLPDCRIVALD